MRVLFNWMQALAASCEPVFAMTGKEALRGVALCLIVLHVSQEFSSVKPDCQNVMRPIQVPYRFFTYENITNKKQDDK